MTYGRKDEGASIYRINKRDERPGGARRVRRSKGEKRGGPGGGKEKKQKENERSKRSSSDKLVRFFFAIAGF